MTSTLHLADLVASVGPLDEAAMEAARARQAQLTKPAGSLGVLEDLAIQLAGMGLRPLTGTEDDLRRAILVLAADHGVTAEGVSAYPSSVTAQMVQNFLVGGAAINQLARQGGSRVVVVDMGVATPLDLPGLVMRRVMPGTANMADGPAMTRDQALAAITAGAEVLGETAVDGLDLVGTGEMGIGNTTAASALTAALTGTPADAVTGTGTGIDEERRHHKVATIQRALSHAPADRGDGLGVLAAVGGLEIAGLVGIILAAAARRIPVVLDGFIASSAALVAVRLCPAARDYLIAGHTSVERGHLVILRDLGLVPLLDLRLRLGEGTGAALAMTIISAAWRAHWGMATFADAGVSGPAED